MIQAAIRKVLDSPDEIQFTDEQAKKGRNLIAGMADLLQKPELSEKDEGEIQKGMIWLFLVQAGQIKHKTK
jgi:hypothetical protein